MTAAPATLDATLDALRHKLAELTQARSRPAVGTLATGCAALDRALGGGFVRGRLVELAGAWSSGKATFALRAAARVTAARRLCLYVDARGELYPPSAAALGVDLTRLLVVRPGVDGVARAGEIAARSGAFPLVVLDFPDRERVEDAAAGRLRAAAAAGGAVVLGLASRAGALAQAPLKLEAAPGVITVRKGGEAPPGTVIAWPEARVDRGYMPAVAAELGPVARRRR
jgi:hypothetical protein